MAPAATIKLLSQTSMNVQCPACVAMETASTTLALIAASAHRVIAWAPHGHSALVRLGLLVLGTHKAWMGGAQLQPDGVGGHKKSEWVKG